MARKYQLHGAFPSKAGESAYEVALKNGFEGTEQEWLDSLVGKQGPQGPAGKDAESVDLSGLIEAPKTAVVGQTIVVEKVGDNGGPIAWAAADMPSGNNATYRHIATIVFDENTDTSHWKITQDEDGNALSLSHVFIRGDVTAADGKGDGGLRINSDVVIPWCFSMQTNGYTAIMDISMVGTTVLFRYMSWESSIKANRFEAYHGSGSSSVISSILCSNAAGVRIPSGSKFEVWGY